MASEISLVFADKFLTHITVDSSHLKNLGQNFWPQFGLASILRPSYEISSGPFASTYSLTLDMNSCENCKGLKVWSLTHFLVFFCKIIVNLPLRANQWPQYVMKLFSCTPSSNSFILVSNYWKAFWDIAPLKGLAWNFAFSELEKQGRRCARHAKFGRQV